MTLDRLLLERAEQASDRLLYTFLDAQGQEVASLTAGALYARAGGVAALLVEAGATGHPVLVCVGPGADHPVALFGCFLAGVTAIPVYPPADMAASVDAMAGVARSAGTRWLLAPEALGTPLAAALVERLGDLTLVALDRAQASGRQTWPGSRPDDAAIVLYTSGSTGSPKGAVITHHGFTTNMRALSQGCGRTADDVVCSWLPHAHIAGLYTRLLAVSLGARAVAFPAAAFAQRPPLWLEVMSQHRCSVTAAPDFAYALSAQVFSEALASELDLSAWEMAVSGGEVVRKATLDRFCARFAASGFKRAAFHPYYGLTETLCTSIPQGGGPSEVTVSRSGILRGRFTVAGDEPVTLIGNGQPLGDTEVLAVEPESRRPTPEGIIGEIWTRGHAVTREYFGDEARTAESCRATLADGSGPWFRTGDLGLMHEGQLFVTGRLKELIIVRGKNHYPLDIETSVQRALADWQVRDCAAFAVLQEDGEEALGLAIEIALPEQVVDEVLRRVRRAVADHHGLAIHRLYLLGPGTLPRTITQKISRERSRQQAAAGRWEAQLVSTLRRGATTSALSLPLRDLAGPALRAALLAQLAAKLGRSGADVADRPLAELGLDSIELAGLAHELRTATGAEAPFSAFFDGSSLRQVVERVAATSEGTASAYRIVIPWREVVDEVNAAMPLSYQSVRSRDGRVLLTGATGFLGAWILRGLLEQSTQEIECLVRASDEAVATERIIGAMRAGPGWDDAWRSRLRALPGDASLPRLGLTEAEWVALAERTAVIVHNAANVNFVAPYSALADVNVAPVHALVALAVHGGQTRPVHYVSTTAVFNASNRREQRLTLGTDRLAQPDFLYSGYAQSKWVAETAFRAANICGVPLAVHRPAVIIGAAATGQSHADDFLCRLIKGCLQLGVYPDVDVELDLVSVDDVGFGIAAAVSHPLPRHFYACQWTAPRPTTVHALFETYRRRGHRLTSEPLADWLTRIRTTLPLDNALFPVHPFLLEVPPDTHDTLLEMLDGLPLRVDASEANEVRARSALRVHEVDEAVLDRMAAWLEATGFLHVAV